MGVLYAGQEPLIGRKKALSYYNWIVISVTSDDIAKGEKRRNVGCPIYLALKRHCTPSMNVRVKKKEIIIQGRKGSDGKCHTYFVTKPSKKVQRFIHNFDRDKPVRPTRFKLFYKD